MTSAAAVRKSNAVNLKKPLGRNKNEYMSAKTLPVVTLPTIADGDVANAVASAVARTRAIVME